MAKRKKETPEERIEQLDRILQKLDEAEKEYTEKLKLSELDKIIAQQDAKKEN